MNIRPVRNQSRSRHPGKTLAGAAWLAAGILGLLGGAAGCGTSNHAVRSREDRDLSQRANGALASAGFDSSRIEARSYCGVVTLLGKADERDAATAQRIVSELPGVVRINSLVLSEGTSASGFARAEKAPLMARAGSVPDSK